MLALYRAWRVARDDASGIALPSGRRILLPNEEARDAFHERANHFPGLEAAAEAIGAELGAAPPRPTTRSPSGCAAPHGVSVRVGPLEGALRRYDPAARR